MSNAPLPPPGMTGGMPAQAPDQITGEMLPGDMSGPPPEGGMPPPGMMMMEMPPAMSARPYIKRALGLFGRHKSLVAASIFLSLIITLLPFVVAAAFGPLMEILGRAAMGGDGDWSQIDRIWGQEGSLYSKADPSPGFETWLASPLTFTTIFIVWAVALILSNLMEFLRSWVGAQLDQRLLTEIRQDVYDHLQSLSLDFFTGGQTGALMNRVLSEAGGVQRLLTETVLTPLVDVLVMIIALAYLLGLSWKMTLVSFIVAPLALLMFRYTSNKLQNAALNMALSNRELSGELEETITGISDIQVFNAQKKRSERFRAASQLAAKYTSGMIAWINLSNISGQVFISISTALVLLVGLLYGGAFGLTVASLIVFVQFVPNMFVPVQRFIGSYTDYQSLVPNVVNTYELLDTKPSVVEKPNAQNLGDVHGHITFESVVFGYTPTQKILNGISFNIKEGETVAFVGPIGCGKSTVMNLTLRFLDPEAGVIRLDGKDISEVTLNSLRDQVSKLSQFPFFLKDTIRENVRLGKADATNAEIEEACRLAHIHDVIVDPQRMPKGYETVVDVQIPSGGQKRLIALARCLLRRPEVLLLDEPTENLDADQRNRLIQVIREYAQDRQNNRKNPKTCLVISHDLNFVAAVSDRIIVLNHGQVAEEGTHEELVQREGLYKTLYELKNIDPALLRKRGDAAPVPSGGMPSEGEMVMGMPPGMEMPV
ncbi:MAG: ABC transporter ATP-binding protein [Pyrinomonadaceae bacterium]